MSQRVRAVLVGMALGIAPLLLLDLARILHDAVAADGDTSIWWPLACYLATGIVAGVGVGAAGRDRIVGIVAGLVLLAFALPVVLGSLTGSSFPLLPVTDVAQAVVFVIVGAYAFAVVRGTRT